jgi:hypothetical protein
MYPDVGGGITCCSCLLADKVKTIFTPGVLEELSEDDPRREWVSNICTKCKDGCDECMMHGSVNFKTYEEALQHLENHKAAGHKVPDYAFEGIKRDMEEGRPLTPTLCECGSVACVFTFDGMPPKCVACASKEG